MKFKNIWEKLKSHEFIRKYPKSVKNHLQTYQLFQPTCIRSLSCDKLFGFDFIKLDYKNLDLLAIFNLLDKQLFCK